jgi:hypothetical protein
MMRRFVIAALMIVLTASLAEASGDRGGGGHLGPGLTLGPGLSREAVVPPVAPNPPAVAPKPAPSRRPHRGGHSGVAFIGPTFIYAAPTYGYAQPAECVADGYWAYQWVPMSSTVTDWIPGVWMADGTWMDGHYEQRTYSSGYYQPYWVPGQSYAC